MGSTSNVNIKQKSSYSVINAQIPKPPEKKLKCVEETSDNSISFVKERPDTDERRSNKNDDFANNKMHRRSNTQVIEDMKTNISMQFEKLKEFKETRTNFQKVLQEKENENDVLEKNVKYGKNSLYFDNESGNFTQRTNVFEPKSNYLQEKTNNYLEKAKNYVQEKEKTANSVQEKPNNLERPKNYADRHNYSVYEKHMTYVPSEKSMNLVVETQNFFQVKQKEKNNEKQEKFEKYMDEKRSNYTQDKPTAKKEYNKMEEPADDLPSARKKYDAEFKQNKSISCHYNAYNKNNVNDFNENENKMSNKFSCNKTSNLLYGQMKIQEKKNEIENKMTLLKQNISKGKKMSNNISMKEVYNMFEDLNDCYEGLFNLF